MPNIARIAGLVGVALVLAACGGGNDNSSSGTQNNPGGQPNQSPPPSGNETQSLNWAGYVKSSSFATYTSVSGSWVVPELHCTDNATSATWVGIGGATTADPTLIQAGIEQNCNGSDAFDYAWWETLPAPQVAAEGAVLQTASYPVAAGDAITVTIDSTLIVWTIKIVDSTQNWTFQQTVPYISGGSSAEWIEESPLTTGSGGAGQLPLANFGMVQFTGVTANGANPALQPADRTEMVNTSGAVLASPSLPGGGGDNFSVCWGSGGC